MGGAVVPRTVHVPEKSSVDCAIGASFNVSKNPAAARSIACLRME
jgi:hypothetical protein